MIWNQNEMGTHSGTYIGDFYGMEYDMSSSRIQMIPKIQYQGKNMKRHKICENALKKGRAVRLDSTAGEM